MIETATTALLLTTLPRAALAAGAIDDNEPPPPPVKDAPKPVTPARIRVGGNVQAANLIRKITPVYPQLAKQARIQGVVRFTAIIGKDGSIQNLTLVTGHPLLLEAARQAVVRRCAESSR